MSVLASACPGKHKLKPISNTAIATNQRKLVNLLVVRDFLELEFVVKQKNVWVNEGCCADGCPAQDKVDRSE